MLLISFGYKHGKLPDIVDVAYDVRGEVRNRYREWKGKTGCDPAIMATVWKEGKRFIRRVVEDIERANNDDLIVATHGRDPLNATRHVAETARLVEGKIIHRHYLWSVAQRDTVPAQKPCNFMVPWRRQQTNQDE